MESWNINSLFSSNSNFEVNFVLEPSVSLFVVGKRTALHIIFFVFCSDLLVFGDRCSSHQAVMLKINWGVGP